MRGPSAGLAALAALAAACSGAPSVPDQPTWADVSPILDGACTGCHGSTADDTGGGYRLDFYDMTADVCGDAAQALRPQALLSAAAARSIATDVVGQDASGRPRMPPLPSPALPDWQRDTLVRWAAAPSKGAPPPGNRPPTIEASRLPAQVDGALDFTVVLRDPDGEAVVGALDIGAVRFLMDRAGSFALAQDTSSWPEATLRARAVLCDGWQSVTYDLGPVTVRH